MPTVDDIVALARGVFDAEPAIELAVLFGSWARDEAHDGSDVDLAVAWRGALPPLRSELALQGRLEDALGRDVDLVDIATATPALRWRIVRDGVLLMTRTPALWTRLRIAIAIEHDDFRDTERRALEHQRRRLLSGGTR